MSDGGEFVAPQPERIFLDDADHVGFRPHDAAADCRRRRHEARVGERARIEALRLVQRPAVGEQLVEGAPRELRAAAVERDREAQRLARAGRDVDVELERAEDPAG